MRHEVWRRSSCPRAGWQGDRMDRSFERGVLRGGMSTADMMLIGCDSSSMRAWGSDPCHRGALQMPGPVRCLGFRPDSRVFGGPCRPSCEHQIAVSGRPG
jgi:hypothetical protein